MSKKGWPNFYYVTMFTFSESILLMIMGTRHMMSDANSLKKGVKFFIFCILISLHGNNLSIKKTFNKVLEIMETLKHLRFMAQEINPSEFAIIINEENIISVSPNQSWCRPHTSENTSYRGLLDTLLDLG